MSVTVLRRAAFLAALIATSSGAAATARAADTHPDFSGTWLTPSFIGTVKTLEGQTPPLRPEALQLYRKRVADRAAGKSVDDPIDVCLPHGIPRLMFAPYPMVILQRPDQLSIVQQANHTQRLIYIGASLPKDPDPKWLGEAVAHWDGQTLVVTTVAQNDRTWLDKAGLPHSEDMKVTERLQLVAGGNQLKDTITVDDPKTYTTQWSTDVTFDKRPNRWIAEAVCSRDHKM